MQMNKIFSCIYAPSERKKRCKSLGNYKNKIKELQMESNTNENSKKHHNRLRNVMLWNDSILNL